MHKTKSPLAVFILKTWHIVQSLLNIVLDVVNQSLSIQGLKLSRGNYISSDAALIQSSCRPKKRIETEGDKVEVIYSDYAEAT